MGYLELRDLEKSFGGVLALDRLSLDLAAGELVSLLGPSGCGKTTALRIVAGFETPDRGSVVVDGRDMTRVPANRRDMGMVFQAYSLFPNMTALGNIQFGLRMREVASADRKRRADELLELVGLSPHAGKYPHQLSGGQQQRVALARALAIQPKILLLDEPLSALDAKVRVTLRDEIRRIQSELGITTLFVTHDQEEALALSDRVGVMSEGRIEQLDTPARVYREPATPFVAQFVGVTNALDGLADGDGVLIGRHRLHASAAAGHPRGAAVRLIVRPEEIGLSPVENGGVASDGRLAGTIVTQSFLGPVMRLTVRLEGDDGQLLRVDVPSLEAERHAPGSRVAVDLASRSPIVVAA
jgi:putative spermidine/putrescine transport system ATP-binding protein